VLANAVIKSLKNGTIPNVVFFSDTDTFPAPPYVVVKLESGSQANTRLIRIIVHHKKGMADELQNYTMLEIDELFVSPIEDDEGNRYRLYKSGYTDITPETDDNTYFMERIFTVPLPGYQ